MAVTVQVNLISKDFESLRSWLGAPFDPRCSRELKAIDAAVVRLLPFLFRGRSDVHADRKPSLRQSLVQAQKPDKNPVILGGQGCTAAGGVCRRGTRM